MTTLNIRDFDVTDLSDEIRVDSLCQKILKKFHRDLLEEQDCDPLEAGSLARGADYFLREFIIADRQDNIFEIDPKRVQQFAGNWYIIKNMEPNMEELTDLLFGIDAFYSWCVKIGQYNKLAQKQIHEFCRGGDHYRARIERFWEITDNYAEWDSEIPLRG